MPIVSAVLTLVPGTLEAHVAAWEADPRIETGPPVGHRLPVVVETDSRGEDRDFWRGVDADPDVLNVEVAFAHFADLTLQNAPQEVTP